MAWGTRTDLEEIALGPNGLRGISSTVVDRHLTIAKMRIKAMAPSAISDDNVPDELIAAQVEIAAYTLVTGPRGSRADDPTVISLKDRHDAAYRWLKSMRMSEISSTKDDATPGVDEGAPTAESDKARGWYGERGSSDLDDGGTDVF